MPKVLFVDDAELKQGDGKGPKFDKGHVYDLAPDQAQRWMVRGKAEAVPQDTPLGRYDPAWREKQKAAKPAAPASAVSSASKPDESQPQSGAGETSLPFGRGGRSSRGGAGSAGA